MDAVHHMSEPDIVRAVSLRDHDIDRDPLAVGSSTEEVTRAA